MCNFLLLTLPFIFLKYIECEQFLRNKELLATLSCLSGTECVAFIFLRNVHPHEVFFMFQETSRFLEHKKESPGEAILKGEGMKKI